MRVFDSSWFSAEAIVIYVSTEQGRRVHQGKPPGIKQVCNTQGSRRDQKIKRSKRREVELDPHFCPEEIMSREVVLG